MSVFGVRSYSGPHSVPMWKNVDQDNSQYGHFSYSEGLANEKVLTSKFQYVLHNFQVQKSRNNLLELQKKSQFKNRLRENFNWMYGQQQKDNNKKISFHWIFIKKKTQKSLSVSRKLFCGHLMQFNSFNLGQSKHSIFTTLFDRVRP